MIAFDSESIEGLGQGWADYFAAPALKQDRIRVLPHEILQHGTGCEQFRRDFDFLGNFAGNTGQNPDFPAHFHALVPVHELPLDGGAAMGFLKRLP